MKKKFMLIGIAGALLLSLSLAGISFVMSPQEQTADETVLLACDKCKTKNSERKCGKCGGFLKADARKVNGNKILIEYKCKKCPHTFTRWERYR